MKAFHTFAAWESRSRCGNAWPGGFQMLLAPLFDGAEATELPPSWKNVSVLRILGHFFPADDVMRLAPLLAVARG